MGDRRRTIQHNQHSSLPVPSSIPRPQTSLRQSLAPSTSRQSLAPGLGHSTGPFANRARASIAPGAYPSSSSQDSNQGPSQPLAGASQGSQFSQGHGGPAREPPMTASRAGHMYTSAGAGAMLGGSMSVARNPGALRSSMAVPGDYAPPRCAPPSPGLFHRLPRTQT